LKSAFGFCSFIGGPSQCLGDSPGVIKKITEGREASLYGMSQLLDALNTFALLIVLLREASNPVCLNPLGTEPLGHTLGKARI
jgi:hypothetical protein